jgi:hypothetical protein
MVIRPLRRRDRVSRPKLPACERSPAAPACGAICEVHCEAIAELTVRVIYADSFGGPSAIIGPSPASRLTPHQFFALGPMVRVAKVTQMCYLYMTLKRHLDCISTSHYRHVDQS